MELYSAESKRLHTLIQEWINRPEQELECTFGVNGTVDSTTFLQIAQRLRMKGYEPMPQDDRLSIITPNHIRMSLQGLGVLQQYCKDDKLQGKPYTAIIKDRTSKDSNIDLEEYDVRIKSRRELPLAQDDPRVREILDNWKMQNKAFRLIRRWTFKGRGIRIDMSMVRSTPRNETGGYRWARSFLDYNIFKTTQHYEVEVELLREDMNEVVDGAIRSLINGVGEVLRAMQKNSILIRNSIKTRVLGEYNELIKSDRFRGVSPITLDVKNMLPLEEGLSVQDGVTNIRTGFNVTDKADGLRTMGLCNKTGELYLIDMAMNVYRTGMINKACAGTLVDGEWVTITKEGAPINHYLVFDIYYKNGEDVSKLSCVDITNIDGGNGRYNQMKKWYNEWKEDVQIIGKGVTDTNRFIIALKNFQFATAGTGIFSACERTLKLDPIYNTDGLILTSNSKPLPSKPGETFYDQFKWKPAIDNTVDFLVNFERDPSLVNLEKVISGIHPVTGETIRYKTMRLFVGSDKDVAYEDPRNTILFDLPIPKDKGGAKRYKPVLFTPAEFPDTMANTCNIIVEMDPETGEEYVITEVTKEPIRDRSIIEMRYDPLQDSGWRWIPIRVRHDKTERLLRGIIARTLNSEKVANSVWNSIHNPITKSMITTGAEEPTEDEVNALLKIRDTDVAKKYYERKASDEDIMLIRGMLDFHNKYIKKNILYDSVLRGGGKKVLDVACGKGGDLQKWRIGNASIVVGVDTAGENITNSTNGAYRRYLDAIVEFGKGRVPQMVFIIGNSSLNIVNGEAGATAEERDMMRSIFGKVQPEGPIPKYIETTLAGSLRTGVDVCACMFALHYFFENKDMLDGLIKNINDTVKLDGYFIGCAFDGDKIFNLLRSVSIGHSKTGREGDVPIWTITKQYDKEELLVDEESIGLAIDVEFISIGTTHREYLIPFDYFKKRMSEIGFEILDAVEAGQIGLRNGTNTFDVSYDMALKSGKRYVMPDSVREFSFLNRWFVFKRKQAIGVKETPSEDAMGVSDVTDNAENTTTSIKPSETRGIVTTSEVMEAVTNGLEEEKEIEEEELKDEEEKGKETGAKLPTPDRKFTDVEVFRFGPEARQADLLKIKDINAGRWLSLSAPFPIPDPDDSNTVYPTIEHFLAGMKLKMASNKPELAKTLMSSTGKIHQEFLTKRRAEGTPKLESARDFELLLDEVTDVRKKMQKTQLNQYRVIFNDTKWAPIKEKLIMDALEYRWERDDRFHKIVESAREQGKYMLYSTKVGTNASELGGIRDIKTSTIQGGNIIGKFIMTIAGFVF